MREHRTSSRLAFREYGPCWSTPIFYLELERTCLTQLELCEALLACWSRTALPACRLAAEKGYMLNWQWTEIHTLSYSWIRFTDIRQYSDLKARQRVSLHHDTAWTRKRIIICCILLTFRPQDTPAPSTKYLRNIRYWEFITEFVKLPFLPIKKLQSFPDHYAHANCNGRVAS